MLTPALRRATVAAVVVALLVAGAIVPAGADDTAGRWFRVQFATTITPADNAALRATGAQGLQYVPRDAYVAFGDRRAQTEAATLPGVTQVRAVTLAEKLDPQLRTASGAVALQLIGLPSALDADRIAALGAVVSRYDLGAGSPLGGVELRADATAIRRLADLDGVLYVGRGTTGLTAEDEGSGQVLAGAVRGNTAPEPGYEEFLAAKGLDGEGVIVSVVDDGLDTLHPELEGRVVERYSYGPENDVVPAEGHGTHVAGILGGFGADVPVGGRMTDGDGLLYGLGIAPKVTFVDQPVIQLATSQTSFPPPGGFPQLSRDALAAGAVAWNASWTDGGGAGVGYVANAAVMDAIVRDGDQDAAGSQPITLVFSAGNSGGPEYRVTSPKEAKNIITVASSRGHRAGDVDAISSFSSRGPARDGRVVPTITAPGEDIASARAFAVGALCGDSPIVETAGLYSTCSGTSMASPQVAGAVALVTQWWRNANGGAEPSPAIVKALLVNSATDLKAPDIPNKDEGWGRVNLGELFDETLERVLVDQTTVFEAPGQSQTLQVEAVDPSRPVKVSLVWTDAPGIPDAEEALVNDLDLAVTTPAGVSYLGNNFVDGASQPGGAPNRLDNVENVYLPGAAGTHTVTVTAANLPGDGVPDNPAATDQDFALVITNGRVLAP